MQTSVTFKNFDPSDTLSTYVSSKLDRFDRYLDNPAEASVVLSVEKFRHIAEINVVGDGLTVNGREETVDMYSAIDAVLDKLEKQIKRSKGKIKDRLTGARERGRMPADLAEAMTESESFGNAPQVIEENIEYKPMDLDEALMQMELAQQSFLVYLNAKNNQVNVLYRRQDGDYGLIQPEA